MLLPVLLLTAQLADPAAFSKPLVELMQAKWPNNRTVTIVCHGHSVPAGYFVTPDVRTFDAYPHLLHEALKRKYPNAVINVIVTAIGGENAEQGAKRFARDVLAHKPDVVTIDYSLNDRGLGLERAKKAWESMIVAATEAGVKVVLLTPSWDLSSTDDPADPLAQQAAQVREMATKYHTGLADSYRAYTEAKAKGTDLQTLMSQVNHPNRAGHEMILKGLLPWFGLTP